MPPKMKDDYRALTGQQKAAMFLLALGNDQSSKLFSMMEDEEIKDISQTMASLGMISAAMIERLFVEFADQLSSTSSLVGSLDSTERLLNKTMNKERVTQIMEEIRGPAGRTMWDKLGNVSPAVLANYLKNEYPQTVAVILGKIKTDHAAKILVLLPENFAMEVILRLLRMEAVQKDILDGVEKTLRAEFMSNLARASKRDAHELMAEIFNHLDRTAEGRFMSALEERNRESADKIKAFMFTFDDLVRIDASGVQTLLRNIPKETLAISLKGATDTIRNLFFKNMSDRAGKMLRDDIDSLGPVRLRDVDQAQSSIVTIAKDLAATGQISIAESRDDELII
jgi:flagellar motor switch protein FliG